MQSAIEAYRASFAGRSQVGATADQTLLDEPGICGLLGSEDHARGQLLVTDDRAAPVLKRLLPSLRAHTVNVFAEAPLCRELIMRAGRWQGDEVTAMVHRDLVAMPSLAVPVGLTVRPVRRRRSDPTDGVSLTLAARACLDAELQTDRPLPDVIASLRGLPPQTRLLAGVDKDNIVRTTAGTTISDADAHTYFVSTDLLWRGRGVATAMTAAALTWARQNGAETASLDASAAGVSIYLRLGFEAASPSTLFAIRRTDPQLRSPGNP